MTIGFSGASDLNGPHRAGGDHAHAIDHFHAFDDAAEDRVAPARGQRVELGVVREVHVELRVRAVRRAEQAMPTVPRLFCRPLPDSFTMYS